VTTEYAAGYSSNERLPCHVVGKFYYISAFYSNENNANLNACNSVLGVTRKDKQFVSGCLFCLYVFMLRQVCGACSVLLKWILVLPSTRYYPVCCLVRTYSPSLHAFIFLPAVTCSFIRACVRKSLFASVIWFSPQVSPFLAHFQLRATCTALRPVRREL
jgi:hypothetical protein